MGQQHRKVEKRQRKLRWMKRKKEAAKEDAKARKAKSGDKG